MYYEYLFGVRYAVTNYIEATQLIFESIHHPQKNKHFTVSALAVHGLMEAYANNDFKEKVNTIDLVVPDGQPIRWALNYLFNAQLNERVYGPTLMLYVLQKANELNTPIFLFGSTEATILKLISFINRQFPKVVIAGWQADRFREATYEENLADVQIINNSGAKIVFVGRGCPRQEKWVSANRALIPAALIAIGAAFDFHAGNIPQAPAWMQRNGLEWLFRLIQEPQRLWKRYLFTNSKFIAVFLVHVIKKPFMR